MKRSITSPGRPTKKSRITVLKEEETPGEQAITAVRKLQRKVNRLAAAEETNYKDVSINQAISYDLNGAVHLSSLTFNADGSSGARRGRWVKPKFLEIRGALSVGISTVSESNPYVRILVVQAKQRFVPQTNSSTATSIVLTSQGTSITPYQPFDINNRRHFTVKHDSSHALGFWNGTAAYANGTLLKPVHLKIKLSEKIQFEDDSTTIEGGQVYILFYSNIVSSSVEPTFLGVSRLTYVDP